MFEIKRLSKLSTLSLSGTRLLSFVLALISLTTVCRAEEDTADGPSPIEWATPGLRAAATLSGFKERLVDYPQTLTRFDAEIEQNLTWEAWSAKLVPWAYLRTPDAIGSSRSDARGYFELKEGWLDFNSPEFGIRAGNQLITWGAADRINPTDVWNPLDLYDPFQSQKLPLPTLRLDIHPTITPDWSLEVLYSPFFRQTRLPISFPETGRRTLVRSDSRWLTTLPTQLNTGTFTLPLTYETSPATLPETWQAGARLKSLRWGGWDFSASVLSVVEQTPRIALLREGNPNNPNLALNLVLLPSYHRQWVFATDGSGSLTLGEADFGLRYEIAYFKRDNKRAQQAPVAFQGDLLKDDVLHSVVGFDHTFSGKFFGTVLYLNAMFVHYQRLRSEESQPGALVVRGLPNVLPWDRNGVLYVESRIRPDLKASWTTLHSFLWGDGMLSPALHYDWSDALKSSLGADWFYGSDLGFFGQLKDNQRVTLSFNFAL